jgi:23S rRNA (uridine2552-2'-O)-methyltransferase
MTLKSSSRRWLEEHHSDPYVKQSKREGYRSRAAYKLLEIQQKDAFIKKDMTVVDLGAAPGGWSQVASVCVGQTGRVVALDILPVPFLPGVLFIQGDFTEMKTLEHLLDTLAGSTVDVVLSDMAPNLSGNKSIDQPRSMYLAELALECVLKVLKPGGAFLTKLFQGSDVDEYVKMLKQHFKQVKIRKPDASRSRSQEVYALSLGFKAGGPHTMAVC